MSGRRVELTGRTIFVSEALERALLTIAHTSALGRVAHESNVTDFARGRIYWQSIRTGMDLGLIEWRIQPDGTLSRGVDLTGLGATFVRSIERAGV